MRQTPAKRKGKHLEQTTDPNSTSAPAPICPKCNEPKTQNRSGHWRCPLCQAAAIKAGLQRSGGRGKAGTSAQSPSASGSPPATSPSDASPATASVLNVADLHGGFLMAIWVPGQGHAWVDARQFVRAVHASVRRTLAAQSTPQQAAEAVTGPPASAPPDSDASATPHAPTSLPATLQAGAAPLAIAWGGRGLRNTLQDALRSRRLTECGLFAVVERRDGFFACRCTSLRENETALFLVERVGDLWVTKSHAGGSRLVCADGTSEPVSLPIKAASAPIKAASAPINTDSAPLTTEVIHAAAH